MARRRDVALALVADRGVADRAVDVEIIGAQRCVERQVGGARRAGGLSLGRAEGAVVRADGDAEQRIFVDLAVEAMRRGARDFVTKPWDNPRLLAIVRNQIEFGSAQRAA